MGGSQPGSTGSIRLWDVVLGDVSLQFGDPKVKGLRVRIREEEWKRKKGNYYKAFTTGVD